MAIQVGKTIVAKRERPESDSERERVRKRFRKRKIASAFLVVLLVGLMGFLTYKAATGWYEWINMREEVVVLPKEPQVEVIDELTGQVSENLSSRLMEYIANLEEEFALLGYNVVRVRIPKDKIREVDVEIEGVSGVVKVNIDRNPAVSAEDGARMIKYLEGQGISEITYIDVRVERKGYWK
ncbi:hypothetical protein IJH29_02010 [Candidatus Saccharibacteria bacterium]|nr:hypothetical protein [Candidatus Saccharibacteria bacterium]